MSQNTLQVAETIEFFTNSPQCINANIANFISVVPLEIEYMDRVYNLER